MAQRTTKIALWCVVALLATATACSGFKQFKETRSTRDNNKTERKTEKGNFKERTVFVADTAKLPDYFWEKTPNARLLNNLPQKPVEDSLLLSFAQNPCFGQCPAFTLEIYESGFVKYNGRFFVEPLGKHISFVNSEIINQIIAFAKALELENLNEFYGIESTDLPSTVLIFNLSAEPNRVEYNADEPESVKLFSKYITDLAQNLKLTRTN
ncbi:MAG: DUF6438 domain-containing protein [Luteibaculaceae bacterium]